MKPLSFFAHVALAAEAGVPFQAQATASLMIEISNQTLLAGGHEKHLTVSGLTDAQKVDLAGAMGRAAALDYLASEDEFSQLPARQFVDFSLAEMPAYLSIRPVPTSVLPNHSRIWRLAESEADQLRVKPLSGSV